MHPTCELRVRKDPYGWILEQLWVDERASGPFKKSEWRPISKTDQEGNALDE